MRELYWIFGLKPVSRHTDHGLYEVLALHYILVLIPTSWFALKTRWLERTETISHSRILQNHSLLNSARSVLNKVKKSHIHKAKILKIHQTLQQTSKILRSEKLKVKLFRSLPSGDVIQKRTFSVPLARTLVHLARERNATAAARWNRLPSSGLILSLRNASRSPHYLLLSISGHHRQVQISTAPTS